MYALRGEMFVEVNPRATGFAIPVVRQPSHALRDAVELFMFATSAMSAVWRLGNQRR
jgi:hypothetical protein